MVATIAAAVATNHTTRAITWGVSPMNFRMSFMAKAFLSEYVAYLAWDIPIKNKGAYPGGLVKAL